MTVLDPLDTPAAPLPAPARFRGRLPMRKFLRTVRRSSIATFPEEAYELDHLERRFLWRRQLVVSAPDAIGHILLGNAANYQKSAIMRRLLEPGLGKGLLTSEGEMWRRHRRIMAPAFNRQSLMRFTPVMRNATGEMLARWAGCAGGADLDVASEMMHLTLTIITRAMFSSDTEVDVVEASVDRYMREVRPGLVELLGLPEWLRGPAHRRMRHALSGIDGIIERLIRRDPAIAPSDDLLALLLNARDESGAGLTAQEIRDEVVTIFNAGHETTAQALSWTWFLLARHPDVEAKLHAELDAVLGGREPGFEDLAHLTYARMVFEEAMRLYPPAHTISRQAVADDHISGIDIAAGSLVLISPWLVHRHRRLWDEPERFDPERFRPGNEAKRPRFAYLPFGAGPRICIGASFAMTEALVILASVAQRYRLRLVPGHPVEPVGLITLRPAHGLRVRLERR